MCIMQQYLGILHLVLSIILNSYLTTIAISYTVFLHTYCVFAILWALHMVIICIQVNLHIIIRIQFIVYALYTVQLAFV